MCNRACIVFVKYFLEFQLQFYWRKIVITVNEPIPIQLNNE